MVQSPVCGPNNCDIAMRLAADIAAQRDVRQAVCDRDADLRIGLADIGLRDADVRPLQDQAGRQRDRNTMRQRSEFGAKIEPAPSLGKRPVRTDSR